MMQAMQTLLLFCLVLAWSPSSAQGKDSAASLADIYLYRSPATSAFFRANESDYQPLLNQWRNYLKKYGANAREIGRKELLAGPRPGVLILASALLLSDEERMAIDAFARRGGSVLASWGTGARDGNGRWRGYQFIEQTFELKVTGEIGRDSERWFMIPYGDGPLTWPLAAGRRMYLGLIAETPIRVDSVRLAARYMDWERVPDVDSADGAIAYTEQQGSRRVYLGFPESAWDYHKRDDINLMLDAMIAWLRREPKMWLAAWPQGKASASLLEMDTEDRFGNAINFARHLEDNGVRGTFYCLTSEAVKHPELVRQLKANGHEVAYHADIHFGFANQPPRQQEERLQNMLEQMASILGPDLSTQTGFRAPTESYDRTTEVLLRKYGMRHHAADPSSTDDRLPFFSSAEPGRNAEDALVVLPRTYYDDISFRTMGFDRDTITKYLLTDFSQTTDMGGLALLSVHSQNYGPEGTMTHSMPFLFRRIGELREKIWIARADDIAKWWRARARVQANTGMGNDASLIDIHVRPPGAVDGISFMVTHPVAGRMLAAVRPLTTRAPAARIVPVDAYRSAIVLQAAEPGTYRYQVRF
jgi:hypothetical protein